MLPEVFKFQEKPVRTVVVDGEPWFAAADVAEALGYKNPNHSHPIAMQNPAISPPS